MLPDSIDLRHLAERYTAAWCSQNPESVAAFYSDQGSLRVNDGAPAVGRERPKVDPGVVGGAARSSYGGGVEGFEVEVAKSGELGYLYGTYSLAIRDPKGGAPVRDTGKLVEIWKKQADGKWKCIVGTYNSDLPAAPAPEAKK